MTPEERRRLRREKVLKRAKLSQQEIANSLINNNIKEVIKKCESIPLVKKKPEEKKEEKNLNYFAKKEKKKKPKKN